MINNKNSRTVPWNYWAQGLKHELEKKNGSIFSLSNGNLGITGTYEEMPPWGNIGFYISGTYAKGSLDLLGLHDKDHILVHSDRISNKWLEKEENRNVSTLPNLPNPTGVKIKIGNKNFSYTKNKILSNERLIQINNGVLKRTMVFRDTNDNKTRIDSQRFVSFNNPNLICIKYKATALNHKEKINLEGFINRNVSNPNNMKLFNEIAFNSTKEDKTLYLSICGKNDKIAITQRGVTKETKGSTILFLYIIAGIMSPEKALVLLDKVSLLGYKKLKEQHIKTYRKELKSSYVDFDGNFDTLQGFNYGQMHLHMAFPYNNNKVGVPIKGLTGHGYRFCNFWDMDFHMFPYYLMTKPKKAYLLLEYRYNQLDQYKENAKKWGAKGAQVPWETQTSGKEATASWLCLQDREIHISADASYMFKLYDELTPDENMMIEKGAEFIIETARFYISKISWSEKNNRYELLDVGCADQYHTFVDNSFFISMMAKWNIEYALYLIKNEKYIKARKKSNITNAEINNWEKILSSFYIIKPDSNNIIEEFDGYFKKAMDIDGLSETYCNHSQGVKQPDVLAAIVPFENKFDKEIWIKNWHFYDKRTLHGSSLSYPGMAYAASRLGLNDEAIYYLHKSSRMDLDDLNNDTDKGIHVSKAALEWQTIVFGFGGLTPTKDCIYINPNLPKCWNKLSFNVYWNFQLIMFNISENILTIHSSDINEKSVPIIVCNNSSINIEPSKIIKINI